MGINSKQGMESKVPLTLCIIIFLITFFINNDFGIGYIYNYILVAGFLLASLLFDSKLSLGGSTLIYLLLTFVVVIFSFLPNSLKDPESNNHAISAILFFLCCALVQPDKKEISRSEGIVLFSAFLMTVYILLVKLVPSFYWNNIYPHLTPYVQSQARTLMIDYEYGVPIGGSANYADYILALALFICCANVFCYNVSKKRARYYIFLSALFLIGMVIQNRRSELISTILTIILMYSFKLNIRFSTSGKYIRTIVVAVVIAAGIMVMYTQGLLDRYIDTFIELNSKTSGSIEEIGNGRVTLWLSAYKKFIQSPLLGIGWNQFRATNNIQYMQGINVHNDYLQWLCETGIVGFTLICIPTIQLWTRALSKCRNEIRHKKYYNNSTQCYSLISFGIQTFFILMHLMDPCFYKLMFWPMFSYAIIMLNYSKAPCEIDYSISIELSRR